MLRFNYLIKVSYLTLLLVSASAGFVRAEVKSPSDGTVAGETTKSIGTRLKETFGITYFSYFFGPGLHTDNTSFYPNQLGLPDNDGIYFQNQLSFRYKFSSNIAIDFQSRFKTILNNYVENENFKHFRWETPRIGISGKLLSGEDWDLTGCVNTDFPYFFPSPFSGYQAEQRKILFTPGMFAAHRYEPKNSKWSFFTVVSPRYLFYSDSDVAEPQYYRSGFIPQNKPEVILSFQPTVNYKVGTYTKITLGTTLDYRKQVVSNWNVFNASLVTNGDSPAWRLNAVPVNLGITYTVSQALTIFPFISTFPIAIQRKDASTGEQASLLEATSFGMWLRGTVF